MACVLGAVTPIGLPVVFDRAIVACNNVNISSGDPSAGVELKADDLIGRDKPILADIIAS